MAPPPAVRKVRDVTSEAYHGTTQAIADKIVTHKEGFKLPNKGNDESRYGNGVYFWLNSKEQAEWWAKKQYEGSGVIAVIRSAVEYGTHINVVSWEGQKILQKVAANLKHKLNVPNVTEAAALNFLAQNHGVDTALILDLPDNKPRTPLFEKFLSPKNARLILCVYKVEKILESAIVVSVAA